MEYIVLQINLIGFKGIIKYDKIEQILEKFERAILSPALKMSDEIKEIKNFKIESVHINDL